MIDSFLLSFNIAYKRNKSIFNDVMFYLLATVVIFSNDFFNYLPLYKSFYSICITFIVVVIRNYLSHNAKRRYRKNNAKKLMFSQLIVLGICVIFIVILNINDIFEDKGIRLIKNYYSFLDNHIVGKESVSEEYNERAFNYFDVTDKENFKKNFPYHEKKDLYELYATTVKHRFICIEKVKKDQYFVAIEVTEHMMSPVDEYHVYDTTDLQKANKMIKNLNEYFEMSSNSPILSDINEDEIKDTILCYLLKDFDGIKKIKQGKIQESAIWEIGARFRLKFRNGNAQNTAHNERIHTIIRYMAPDTKNNTISFLKKDKVEPIQVLK